MTQKQILSLFTFETQTSNLKNRLFSVRDNLRYSGLAFIYGYFWDWIDDHLSDRGSFSGLSSLTGYSNQKFSYKLTVDQGRIFLVCIHIQNELVG
jgi:hypothetical protein